MQVEMSRLLALPASLLLLGALTPPAGASDLDCARDQFSLQALDGEVIAFSGLGGSRAIDLERQEEVLDRASSGCVAVVSTSRRLLVISALSGAWTPIRYEVSETPAEAIVVGDLVALAITNKRIIGYDPRSTRVVTTSLPSRETVTDWSAGSSVAAVATDRRLIGFSAGLRTFAEKSLRLGEPIESFDRAADVLTVITPNRILTLRAGSGLWGERNRRLR